MIHIKTIFEIVQRETKVTAEELIGKSREKHIADARFLFYRIARESGYGFTFIGRAVKRDHTTVISGFERSKTLRDISDLYEKVFNEIQMLNKIDNKLDIESTKKIFGKYTYTYKLYQGKCAICSFDEVVEIHHILPRYLGGTDVPSNLILLCPNHHALVDKGMLSIKDIHIKNLLSTEI